MATTATTWATRSGHRGDDAFFRWCLAFEACAAIVLAPLLPVAIPVAALTLALRWRYRLLLVVAGGGTLTVLSFPDPAAHLNAYAELQRQAGVALLDWRLGGTPFDWLGYARSAAPYALGYGPLLGVGGGILFSLRGKSGLKRHDLTLVSADALARMRPIPERTSVDGFCARGRLTAITALPKQGKSVAFCGLLKARQEGGEWFGRACRRGKTCIMTEEDRETFSAKVRDFGLNGKTLDTIHAPEVPNDRFGREAWAGLVEEACRRAKRKGCDTLALDTLTTWAPWALTGGEAMSECLRTLKHAVGRHKLAGVVVLHNRKTGSELGAVVAMLGSIAGAAAYDVVAGFEREKATGECTLTVDGRLGEWECTARLVDGRYVPVTSTFATTDEGEKQEVPAPIVPRMAGTLDVFRRAAHAGLTMEGAQAATKLPAATLRRYVLALTEGGHLVRSGAGVSGDPHVWTATDLPPRTPTSDPEYLAYLQSPEWKRKCRLVLERCELRCEAEGCGAAPKRGDSLEVHHLSYEQWRDPPLSHLIALCPPCHRAAPTPPWPG